MPQESFLARRKFGVPHWLLIALVTCFVMGWVPRGIKQSLLTNNNNAADWLPASYTESQELLWFRDHFISAQFVLASWEGCTLGNSDRLHLLAKKLRAAKSEDDQLLFSQVLTGPEMVEVLTQPPARLGSHAAVERLEGALVGPPQPDIEDYEPDRPDLSRTTCLVVFLSDYSTESNRRMREAVDAIQHYATEECGVKDSQGESILRLGGPPVDNVTIDVEGEKTLARLAVFSGIVGIGLAYFFFRSIPTTLAVFYVAGASAAASMGVVYYYGVVAERWLQGMPRAHIGTVDAILLSMPAVVYVLGLAGAIHLVNYYRDERDEHGEQGAAERSVRIAFLPCALAAFTTSVGLGSLAFSDIVPIMKFGAFTAAGVLLSVGVLFAVLPIFLHLFPPKLAGDNKAEKAKPADGHTGALPPWARRYCHFVTSHPGVITVGCFAVMVFMALGLPQIRTQVSLLKLLDKDVPLIHDYAWLEQHLGNLVPMEVVVTLTPDQIRLPSEEAEGADRYRMTMYERLQMVKRLEDRVEKLSDVSRAMSAATFSPEQSDGGSATEQRSTEYATSMVLEENRAELSEYLRTEIGDDDRPRELWRVSARVAALADIDYGQFVSELQASVEPVLDAYRLRDQLVAELQKNDKPLVGAKVCVAYYDDAQKTFAEGTPAALTVDLLEESKGPRGRVIPLNIAALANADQATRTATLAAFQKLDAVVATTDLAAEELGKLTEDLTIVTPVSTTVALDENGERISPAFDQDASLSAVYTGIVPLVFKTQRELLKSLRESILMATVLIAFVMMGVFRNVPGGLISMIPNVFPVVMVFGALGWMGVYVDIGIMMTASVALGVAVDDTIHFLTWFRRGLKDGLDRQSATRLAFERCGVAMTQTTLIAGLGLAVFSTSTFTPTQQFGMLMITILSTALVGDLLMLPALLCGPLGWFFAPKNAARPPADASEIAAPTAASPMLEPVPDPTPEEPAAPTGEAARGPDDDESAGGDHTLSPANAALHAKLRGLRRSATDSVTRE